MFFENRNGTTEVIPKDISQITIFQFLDYSTVPLLSFESPRKSQSASLQPRERKYGENQPSAPPRGSRPRSTFSAPHTHTDCPPVLLHAKRL